jgi:hypothetical protein
MLFSEIQDWPHLPNGLCPIKLSYGLGVFFSGKMPGCCLPSLTAATALHFTAGDFEHSLQQEPTQCYAFLGGRRTLSIRSTGAIILT